MIAKIIWKQENLGHVTKKKSNTRAFATRAKNWKYPILTTRNQVVFQDIKIYFEEAHLDAKINWILFATLWNSTIVITLTYSQPNRLCLKVNSFRFCNLVEGDVGPFIAENLENGGEWQFQESEECNFL